jgi:integrase
MPLYKRPGSPYWQVRIGRKYRASTGTEDYEQAQEFERYQLARLWRIDKLGDRGGVQWKEAASRWLASSAKEKRRDREFLVWLEQRIGSYSVADVADPDALEELRKDGLDTGWSQATIDRMMGTVSAVLKACVKWRYLESAPSVPMYRPGSDEPRFLSPAELNLLCSNLPMHLALAARVAVHTLLRMRAMLQLTWNRVDLHKGIAWVPRAHQKTGRTFGLKLNETALFALRGLRWISPPKSPYVFTWNGKRIDDCNTASFKEGVRKAGLEPLRWHDLRHTGASWAVQNGATLQEVMLLGDWRDYRSVLRYAHLAPFQAAQAADRVAQWANMGTQEKGSHERKKA